MTLPVLNFNDTPHVVQMIGYYTGVVTLVVVAVHAILSHGMGISIYTAWTQDARRKLSANIADGVNKKLDATDKETKSLVLLEGAPITDAQVTIGSDVYTVVKPS